MGVMKKPPPPYAVTKPRRRGSDVAGFRTNCSYKKCGERGCAEGKQGGISRRSPYGERLGRTTSELRERTGKETVSPRGNRTSQK